VELYASSLAVMFVPVQEDFGLVAFEGMSASKPIITAHDSGGVAELVTDGETGCIVDPTPEALAAQVERLVARPRRARAMGRRGRAKAATITWDRVCHGLFNGLE
jgi:glycosyltransferase involved in cell wall biosynthesis